MNASHLQELATADDTATRFARYRRLFEIAHTAIVIVRLDNQKIVDANPALMSLLGYSHEETIGRELWEIGVLTDRIYCRRTLSDFALMGSATVREEVVCRKDGSICEVDVAFDAYFEGATRVLECSIRDIHVQREAERTVRNANERYRALAEAAPDDVFILNRDRILEYVNPHCAGSLGLSAEELIGCSQSDLFPGVEGSMIAKSVNSVFGAGESLYEEIALPVQGKEKWLSTWLVPLKDGQGAVTEVMGVARDITMQKSTQATINEAQRLAQDTLDALPSNIAVIDGKGTIVAVNAAWRAFAAANGSTGHAAGLGTNYLDVCQSSSDSNALAAVRGLKAVMAGESNVFIFEYPCDSETETRWFEMRATRFGSADSLHLVVAHENITARKEAESRLRTSEANLARAQEMAHLGSWELELGERAASDHRYIQWSDEVFRIMGLIPGEILPTRENLLDRIHPEDRKTVVSALRKTAETGGAYDISYRILLPDGAVRMVQEHAEMVKDSVGKPIRAVGTIKDVTERHAAESQLEFQRMLLEAQSETSLDGILVVGSNNELLYHNQRFLRMWSIPNEIAATRERALWTEYACRLMADPATLTQPMAYLNSHPEEHSHDNLDLLDGRVIERYTAPIGTDASAYCGRVIYFRDVTDRKTAESDLRRMHEQLEHRVLERTAELARANEKLQLEIAERERAEAEIRVRVRQQAAVAELGRRALTGTPLDSLLVGAAELVRSTLDIELCTILELQDDSNHLRLRAGAGWPDELLDIPIAYDPTSQARYALLHNTPIVVTDLRTETRFHPSVLLREHGVVSGMTIVLAGYKSPFGTLGAHSIKERLFTQDDLNFLEAMANVLSAAIEQRRIESSIRVLNGQLNTSNVDLQQENLDRRIALTNLRVVTTGLELAKREAEAARETAELANRAKSEFLSRMSHELRTPLTAILGFGQLLEMHNAHGDHEQLDNIRQVLKAGRHLLNLINEVLDIARIESGHLALACEGVQIGPLATGVIDLVRPLATAQGMTLLDCISPALGAQSILADRQRLRQVLLNFLSNALKYNHPAGSVILSCAMTSTEAFSLNGYPCAGRIRLEVRDTGPGLSREDLSRLFIPFERLSAAQSEVEGSGIGLSLCKQLVEAMHGAVGVESAVGNGSCFWLEMPVLAGDAEVNSTRDRLPYSARPRPAAADPFADCPRSMLLIEDNLPNVQLLERVIAGISPNLLLITALQGSTGLDRAAERQPDLILLDLNLPDLKGETVLERLKADERTSRIPVLMLTADAMPHQAERLLALGADRYMTKPLDIEEFATFIRAKLSAP